MKPDRTPRNGLGITDWALLPGEVERTGLDVPGVMFAGWWQTHPPELSGSRTFESCWPPNSATFLYLTECLEELGGFGFQMFAYVRVIQFPEKSWLDVVRDSLQFFIARGAAIAWAGGYECFVRYEVGSDFRGCYAALASGGEMVCLGDLDEPLRYIDEKPALVGKLHRLVSASRSFGK